MSEVPVNNLFRPPPFICPAVSVIIPLYNAAKYIGECLNSLLSQTFQNFEVIVVDDCSTDNSFALVESYVPKFGGRLTLSRMGANTGSGALPRNKGLQLSRGEYVFFVDADDLLTPIALDEMYTLAKSFDADVVYCEKHYEVDADGTNKRLGVRQKGSFVDKPTFETENLAERIKDILRARFSPSTCFKFTRRKLMIEYEIFFPQICPSEDDIWTYSLIFYAKKFLRVPNAVYIRRHSEGSVMRTKRTPQETINFWLNPALLGLKALDKLMSNHDFFKENPQYRYAMLDMFLKGKFNILLKDSLKLPPATVYETIRQKFGDRLGDHDVLICALCTALNTQQKISAVERQEFNQFAAAAKARIAALEAEVKRLSGKE